MRARVMGLVLLSAFLLAPASVSAQFQVGVTGGFYTLSGDDFEDTEAGAGFDVVGRFFTSDNTAIGIGGQFNTHGVENSDIDIDVLNIFGELRHNFDTGGTALPFLSGRAGWVRASADEGGFDLEQNGFGIGAVGGLVFDLAESIGLEASALVEFVSLGDLEADGQTLADSDASGWVLGLRVGLNFGGM